eukprot:281589_1
MLHFETLKIEHNNKNEQIQTLKTLNKELEKEKQILNDKYITNTNKLHTLNSELKTLNNEKEKLISDKNEIQNKYNELSETNMSMETSRTNINELRDKVNKSELNNKYKPSMEENDTQNDTLDKPWIWGESEDDKRAHV